jgi:biotin carboxyl carrier protein
MKKFKLTIRGNKYDVDLLSIEDDIAKIEVNGTTYEVEVHSEKKVSKTPTLVRKPVVHSSDSDARTSKPNEKKGAGIVKAPLPGTILEIKVKVGDVVKIGDKLIVMEAMKMENNINADKEGTISEIKVNTGDSVLEGEALVEIGS